jgi:hypothetical protein
VEFQVERSDLHTTRLVELAALPLSEGEVRLRVDAFALTANTLTYGAIGEQMGYWDAFPVEEGDPGATARDDRRWGRIPAWGVAEVVESRSEMVPLRMRVSGFVPMSSEFVATPGKVGARGFSDVSPHRARLASVYNRYARLPESDGPGPSPDEVRRMVHEPLFFTSFLIADQLADQPELDHVVLSSASSKTAIGTAFCTRARGGVTVVGLTSAGHRAFVEDLSLYDHVFTYDGLVHLPDGVAAYVDIAGSAATRTAVHERYGDALRTSLIVGRTHWDAPDQRPDARPPGPEPALFLATTRIAERTTEWGRAALEGKVETAWREFLAFTDGWLRYDHADGTAALEATYRDLLANRADPRVAATRAL